MTVSIIIFSIILSIFVLVPMFNSDKADNTNIETEEDNEDKTGLGNIGGDGHSDSDKNKKELKDDKSEDKNTGFDKPVENEGDQNSKEDNKKDNKKNKKKKKNVK